MDLIQFIGFVISMLALIFLTIKRSREEKRRKTHPEEFKGEREREEQAYRDLLRSLELPIPPELDHEIKHPQAKSSPRPPPAPSSAGWKAPEPKRMVQPSFQYQATLDARHQKTRIEQRSFQSPITGRQGFKQTVVSKALQPEAATSAYNVATKGAYNVSTDAYAFHEEVTIPRARTMVEGLSRPLEMILFYEMIKKPKGLQPIGRLEGLPWEGI